MSDTIALSKTLRINDYDAQQYTVEKKVTTQDGPRAGEVQWVPLAYVGTIKALSVIAKRMFVEEMVQDTNKAAQEMFDQQGFAAHIAKLPPKGKE